jgi:hypothetical protein
MMHLAVCSIDILGLVLVASFNYETNDYINLQLTLSNFIHFLSTLNLGMKPVHLN